MNSSLNEQFTSRDQRKSFCKMLPKVELHAHLNGSLSYRTMEKLNEMRKLRGKQTVSLPSLDEPMSTQIFKLFGVVHRLTNNAEAVYKATCDVIEEFASDGVRYLELRSTLREELDEGMTRETYIKSMISAIENKTSELDIIVKLIISIDRAQSVEKAVENVKVAERFYTSGDSTVVGVDFSGNPEISDVRIFLPVLERAKSCGLKLTCHIAEFPNREESRSLLQSRPDRIGHGTFLHKFDNDIVKYVIDNKIPIEICPTSNIAMRLVDSYEDSHFRFWYADRHHPVTVCTDDKGMFKTSLSNEYAELSSAFSLTQNELWTLTNSSVNYIFDSEATKLDLSSSWRKTKADYISGVDI